MRTLATVLLMGTLAACGHDSAARGSGAPATPGTPVSAGAAPSDSAPEMAPTPYSAAQIRDSNRPGTLYRYKLETAGQAPEIKVIEFTSGTSAEMAEVKSVTFDESGRPKSPPDVERTPWEALRRHAEFPRATLTVAPGSIEVPAGKFEVMIYTLNAPNGEKATFYFAKSYAGPPVLLHKERAGARLMTSTLIERKSIAP